MDLALRTLREGRSDPAASAPLLLLRDSLATVGGPALLRHAVAELAAAVAALRAQAASLLIVALERPAQHYQQLCSQAPTLSLTVLDGFCDPHAWGALLGDHHAHSTGGSTDVGGGQPPGILALRGVLAASDGILQLQRHLLGSSGSGLPTDPQQQQQQRQGSTRLVIFDSLSPLLDAFGAAATCQLLYRLATSPATSAVLCGLHADLHPAPAAAAAEQLAAGVLSLHPATDLERTVCAASHGLTPHGRLEVRLRRRSGRVRAEAQLYCLDGAGGTAFLAPPADLLNPAAAADKAAGAAVAGGDGAGPLAQQLAGGMKLSLTRGEQEARQRVQLPFEHQGQGSAYQTGDWLDYLPPQAGGRAPSRGASAPAAAGTSSAGAVGAAQHGPAQGASGVGPGVQGTGAGQQQREQQQQQQLGRILYVRDSGSELDSDEDPDDDLDI